eukprot:3939616-Rhodomonas_salina.2
MNSLYTTRTASQKTLQDTALESDLESESAVLLRREEYGTQPQSSLQSTRTLLFRGTGLAGGTRR